MAINYIFTCHEFAYCNIYLKLKWYITLSKSYFVRLNFGRQEDQPKSFVVFGKFAIWNIWYLLSQHLDTVCTDFGHIL